MRRRLALALVSAWLALTVATAVVATTTFRTVDRVLTREPRPELVLRLAPRAPEDERPVLRYLASEINRTMFRLWAGVDGALAVALAALVLLDGEAGRTDRAVVGVLCGLTAVLDLGLMPLILAWGPPLDFVPRPFPPEWAEAGHRFALAHGLFSGLDLLKVGLLAALLARLLGKPERARGPQVGPAGI